VCVRARIYTHTYIQGKAERAEARIAALDFGGSLIQDMKGGEGAGRCYQKSLYSTLEYIYCPVYLVLKYIYCLVYLLSKVSIQ